MDTQKIMISNNPNHSLHVALSQLSTMRTGCLIHIKHPYSSHCCNPATASHSASFCRHTHIRFVYLHTATDLNRSGHVDDEWTVCAHCLLWVIFIMWLTIYAITQSYPKS